MSTMIEQVARAIIRARHRTCCQQRPLSDFPVSDHEMNEARAAIEAMRRPPFPVADAAGTAAIKEWVKREASNGHLSPGFREYDAAGVGEAAVAAMIDAALKD